MLSLLVWNSTRLAHEHLVNQAERHIKEIQPLLNASIAGPLFQEDLATLGEILDQVVKKQGVRYIAVYDASGRPFIRRGLPSHEGDKHSIDEQSLQQHIGSPLRESPFHLRAPVTLAGSQIGHLILEIDTQSIIQAIDSVRRQGTTIAAVEIILSIFLLTLLAVGITRNLLKLTAAVSSLSPEGDIPELDIDAKDEVGGLARAFINMAKKLRQRERERDAAARATQASDARYRRLVENLSSEYFFYSHDTEGVFFYVSESITDVLGYSPNDFLAHFSTYLTDNPINKSLFFRADKRRPGKRRPPFIISVYHKDGSERMLEVSESPVVDDEGNILAMEGIAHDITARLREADELRRHRDNLEIRVAERTIELETINDELESFCYSVSHDLRAPLRGINGFSNALLEDYEQSLDETGRDYLRRITLGTERMSQLIDDMLNLSRITRQKMNVQKVNISELARDIVQSLRESDPQRDVNVVVEEGLEARGDKNLLSIALSNLIGNAWKYTSKRDNADIRIFSSTDDNGGQIFTIEDNGAGFNPDYIDKIFVPFQRLHSAEDFPGTGVGLSTVYRVISRHQGKIWAKATPGEGASFFFTLEIPE